MSQYCHSHLFFHQKLKSLEFVIQFIFKIKISYFLSSILGRTRTKDKYRVVYSDHQRLELEKEFHYSRYITIRRKAELAQALSLSERQVSHVQLFVLGKQSHRYALAQKFSTTSAFL